MAATKKVSVSKGAQAKSSEKKADFFIGAHVMVAKMHLLTRDPKRYKTYFPQVNLIAPH